MPKSRIPRLLLLLFPGLAFITPEAGEAIPYFARKYDVSCSRCHALPPKLNEFGEEFVRNGYHAPGLQPRPTWPLAVWISGRGESRPVQSRERDEIGPFLNRIELISGGRLIEPWLSYFAEWRPVSRETRGDGTLRDRSGRFEDLFLTAAPGAHLVVDVGQFRQIAQVDVSRRLSLSEPLVLSASLPGEGGGDARERSLRAFSPSGRSPSLRAGWRGEPREGWSWTTSVALPVPGEFSIPLTSEAEVEASNEIELRAKGVVAESFLRRGLTSYGGHVFYDDADRYLGHAIASGNRSSWFWTAMAGVARSGGVDRGRWSIELEYVASSRFGAGARLEDQATDGAEAALLPYVVLQWPGRRHIFALTLEQRLQEDRNTTLIEIGAVF